MAQVTVNLPVISNWKTTLFGILTTVGGALWQHYLNGGLTWPVAVALALWTVFCYLVPDAAKNTNGEAQIQSLLEAVAGLKAQIPPLNVQNRTDAPATDANGLPLVS